MGVPDRTGDYEPAPGEERRYDLEHFTVSGFFEVDVPEQTEHFFEGAGKSAGSLEREKI